jgi:hypothetical protein
MLLSVCEQATASKWTSAPFDAVVTDERVTAKGAFQDKVNICIL